MVKHIILWKLKEEYTNNVEIKNGMKRNLESLLGKIDGLLEINVQTDKLPSSNADVMLYALFENEEALKNYSVHREHVWIAENSVRPFTKTRTCFDFEV